jgi:hypothetical protein
MSTGPDPYPCERARADLRMGWNIMNRRTTLVLVAALLVVPAFAADPSGFALWKSAELKQRDEALSKKVGPDHSARETLADYSDHRFRMLYRDADGFPEQHDNVIDVVIVQSGEGTLVVGGKMINPEGGGGAGEYLGTSIEGGERHPLGPGDIVHIPAKIPHSFLCADWKTHYVCAREVSRTIGLTTEPQALIEDRVIQRGRRQAPRVVLPATHEAALSYRSPTDLERYAVDLA